MFEQELKKALQANRPEPLQGFENRMDCRLARLKQEEKEMKKVSGFTLAAVLALVLCMATAIAAGVIGWNRGLEDRLNVTEEFKAAFEDSGLFDSPNLSVTRDGINVTLEQCIVDSGDAYFAFRVTGYQPDLKDREYQERPQFRDVDVRMEGIEKVSSVEPLFFDGLDGNGLLTDGSVPEDYNRLPYQTADGEMVFIIRMRCDSDDFSFVGKDVRVTLGGLGVASTRYQDVRADAEGPWEFAWTLKGTDRGLKLDGLDLPLGDTGSVLNAVDLQPIHIRMILRVPREPEPEDPEWPSAPVFRGFRLKDGAVLDMVAGRGIEYCTDESGEEYYITWELLRAVDPDQVESLRFTASHKDPEDVADSEIFEVGIR